MRSSIFETFHREVSCDALFCGYNWATHGHIAIVIKYAVSERLQNKLHCIERDSRAETKLAV